VSIRSVYVGITGGHIASFNNRGVVELPEDRDEIDDEDLEDVKQNAREVNIPAQNAFLHAIIQHYYVDGQNGVLTPVGMLGNKLEADYHIVHGVRTRVQNTIRCVKEVPLEVEDVVLNSLASAQVVVSQNQKNLGVLVIDIGGGTIDYLVYVEGAIKQSGVLAIGGDHITNDISMGLRIPIARAERLKIDEGSAVLGNCLPGETLLLPAEPGFAGREIERETLNTIIHSRLREAFELLKRRLEAEPYLRYLGAGAVITGGCSLIHGINHLAEDVLGLPVQPMQPPPLQGITSALANPQLSTVLGLIKYAQMAQLEQPAPSMWARLKGRLFGRRKG
jgi:cell division protein FtsA